MVDESFDDRGHVVVPEHRSPTTKTPNCRDDQAALFIPVRDDLEQQRRALGIDVSWTVSGFMRLLSCWC